MTNKEQLKNKTNAVEKKIGGIDKNVSKINKLALKQALNQTLNTYGLERMLFPLMLQDCRHPFTQEVMLLADEHGFKQSQIAELCGVSQPTVSGWENGEGRASHAQIEKLTRKLSARAPGNEFYIFDIATSAEHVLSEDWEVKMLAKHLRVDTSQLKQHLWENIQQKVREEFEQREQEIKGQLERINDFISELETLIPQAEQEAEENQREEERYASDVETLLTSKPGYAALDEDSRQILFERQLESVQLTNRYNKQLERLSEQVSSFFGQEEIEIPIADLRLKRDEKTKELELFQQEAEQKEADTLKEKSPLNKYQHVEDALLISKGVLDLTVGSDEVERLCSLLFEQEQRYQFSIPVKSSNYWGSEPETRSVDASFTELFCQYAKDLKFSYVEEKVQLCGKFLLNHQQAPDDEDFYDLSQGKHQPICASGEYKDFGSTFDLFRLHSNKLALVEGRFDQHNGRCFYQLTQFTHLDDLITHLEPKINKSTVDEWTEELMNMGYTLNTVRMIY
ncbi:helix-turn-helix domain-containing protein [Vibrio sp. TRT 1302]|uniref:helix-turn-helix domain-containing protein n=1 Tax=Vibrio sp. TRT 1302 TaxID=3418504 RepID=UPI003CF3EF2F